MTHAADLHTLTGAYALHALSDTERAAFQRHLHECEACAQEVRELEATAARLGTAAAVTPPPEMKEQVLARIMNVRQLGPPVAADLTERQRRRLRATAPRLRRLPRLVVAACVAAALASGGFAVHWYQEAQRAERSVAAAERMSSLLGAPDAVSTSARVSGGGSGVVVLSRSRDEAAFFGGGLPELPENRTYQLWFADGSTLRSAGLLPRPGDGDGRTVLLAEKVRGASGVGLTVEPAGGSEQPTTDPLLLLEFPA